MTANEEKNIQDTQADPVTVGKTRPDQERNAALLSGYDYSKYVTDLTGYTGQDLQRVGFVKWQPAARTRCGGRGNYKPGMARLPDGKLIIGVCRNNNDPDPAKRWFEIHVYESEDDGLTWSEIGTTPLYGKEPAMAALADGTLVMTVQGGFFGDAESPGGVIAKPNVLPVMRSDDGGKTWDTFVISGATDVTGAYADYPRNLIAEADGSVTMVRALKNDYWGKGGGSPNLQIANSRDGGESWTFEEGLIDWNYCGFGEVATIRLRSGKMLAALRTQTPGTTGEGFETTVITESLDGGTHWSEPTPMLANAEVHAYLTELADGRILASYSNYHLPWGSFAVVSSDEGKSWDLDNPIQLSLSQDLYVGWPVTLQLPDESLVTCCAVTSHQHEPPETTTCDVVRWKLPDSHKN